MKAQKFITKHEAQQYTKEARANGLNFSTYKFATKRKYQYFSGTWYDWLAVIS